MIKPMMFIKHERSMDICFEVFKKWDIGDRLVIKGQWINQGFVESYPIHKATIKIYKSELSNWLKTNDYFAKCLRYSQWSKV